jgi:hypothetical protein
MKCEHWTDPFWGDTLVNSENPTKHIGMSRQATICCVIEGENFEDCMRQYYEHMGLEPYTPQIPLKSCKIWPK